MAGAVVKSTQRAFAIFEMFDRERRPLSLKSICEEFGYAPSSGSALLKSLVSLGYLDFNAKSRTYLPTMRIAHLGLWVEAALFGDGEILRLMKDLHAATGQVVILATQSGLSAQYIHTVAEQPLLHFEAAPGTLRPLAASGVGLMLLSEHSDKEIKRICHHINYSKAAAEPVDYCKIIEQVEFARREGYMITVNMPIPDSAVLSMLLPGSRYGRTFALGVAIHAHQLEEQRDSILSEMRGRIAALEATPPH
ncbi:MAG: helix-turn-helix domain-containing protein [Phenylobacterium sp.]|uniref:IclR family transcriptional regulator n=1 Tax=Phenylobacterium sp. TaxID=1871053 RepID=UPI0027335C3B|nr:helix-turn-helix domain-containing protein [Phenylobacterium sp.]MDP3173303.1 helix-turn-helix domain-containing protein [Phenylobacterium sp.]